VIVAKTKRRQNTPITAVAEYPCANAGKNFRIFSLIWEKSQAPNIALIGLITMAITGQKIVDGLTQKLNPTTDDQTDLLSLTVKEKL